MMGSRNIMGNGGVKRKRDSPVETSNDYRHDYFFAKFLTSPELLELEVRIIFNEIVTELILQLSLRTHSSGDKF